MEILPEYIRYFVVVFGLFVFGMIYAYLIYIMRKRNWLEPYTAFMVVFGVLITLLVNKFIHQPYWINDLFFELACFAASGSPMIIGSMATHSKAIENDDLLMGGE